MTENFWAIVCKTVRPMPSDRCLSGCLPVCNICVLWPNGWMDQDETWHAGYLGLGPGHTVLDRDPAPLPRKGHSPLFQIFGPYLFWPNGWMDQNATW